MLEVCPGSKDDYFYMSLCTEDDEKQEWEIYTDGQYIGFEYYLEICIDGQKKKKTKPSSY